MVVIEKNNTTSCKVGSSNGRQGLKCPISPQVRPKSLPIPSLLSRNCSPLVPGPLRGGGREGGKEEREGREGGRRGREGGKEERDGGEGGREGGRRGWEGRTTSKWLATTGEAYNQWN